MQVARDPVGSDFLSDPSIVCAKVDAKLFGRLRLLSLEARVVVGKPAEAPLGGPSRATGRRAATLQARTESASDLGSAIELWTLSSEVLANIPKTLDAQSS